MPMNFMKSLQLFKNKKGYLLEQSLVSMMIASFCIPIVLLCFFILHQQIKENELIQDEIALSQLRHILNMGTNFQTSGNYLSFTYQNETNELYLINDHLILTPGTQIFFQDIESVQFSTQNGYLYVTYTRKNDIYEAILTKL